MRSRAFYSAMRSRAFYNTMRSRAFYSVMRSRTFYSIMRSRTFYNTMRSRAIRPATTKDSQERCGSVLCQRIDEVFSQTDLNDDYNYVTTIPEDAMNITIKHLTQMQIHLKNYLVRLLSCCRVFPCSKTNLNGIQPQPICRFTDNQVKSNQGIIQKISNT
uniref:Uncharacterized protein n=1 Tax=Glossina brevipalpis TaxID=37001 RepID=A0A1A9WQH3_9MUSC